MSNWVNMYWLLDTLTARCSAIPSKSSKVLSVQIVVLVMIYDNCRLMLLPNQAAVVVLSLMRTETSLVW